MSARGKITRATVTLRNFTVRLASECPRCCALARYSLAFSAAPAHAAGHFPRDTAEIESGIRGAHRVRTVSPEAPSRRAPLTFTV